MYKLAATYEITDYELVELSRKGDQFAFSEIVKRHKARVASTVFGMLGHCQEAEDIGQEVFIRFFKAIDNFRGESLLSTYLTRIAINLSLNEIKRRKIKRFLPIDNIIEAGADIVSEHYHRQGVADENREIVQKALNKLNPKYRSVAVLRLIDGYSTEETAKILDLPFGTVLSRLSRAQKKLKELLNQYRNDL